MDVEPEGPPEGAPTEEHTVVVTQARGPVLAVSRADWVHSLVVVTGTEAGRRQRLGPQPLRLGRRAPAELVLVDSEVSGLHCQVWVPPDSETAMVEDLGSTNGCFIDGRRVREPTALEGGALLQVGRQLLRHEFRPPHDAERSDELDRDLEQASRYIQSLLPPPRRDGPVRTEWIFQPSARLGGDAFGYGALGEGRFAGYLIDVSGHGVAAAVHTVSVLNVLRQRALPGVDMTDPAQVLARLNAMYPMDEHGGLFFTMWYGVYDTGTRQLAFASAGHHPAYLVAPDRQGLASLSTSNPMIGAMPPDHRFKADAVPVAAGSTLYLFSDGVFEIETPEGRAWRLADFTPLLLAAPEPGKSEPERLVRAARRAARSGPPDDDVSLLAVTFMH